MRLEMLGQGGFRVRRELGGGWRKRKMFMDARREGKKEATAEAKRRAR